MIFGLGIAIRGVLGSAMFLISFFELPILKSLQIGGGFWALAPDARVYFHLAQATLVEGIWSGGTGAPSPAYIRALGAWFSVAGAKPGTAVLFNIMCYAAAVFALSRFYWRGDGRRSTIPFVAITFSPVLLLSSSQVLKESLFELLIVVACVAAVRGLAAAMHSHSLSRVLANTCLGCVAIALIAGIRAYFAFILWMGAAGAMLICAIEGRRRLLRTAASGCAVLVVLWMASAAGAADYYSYYRDLAARATGLRFPQIGMFGGAAPGGAAPGGAAPAPAGGVQGVEVMTGTLVTLRRGFEQAGGATNLSASEPGNTRASVMSTLGDVGVGALVLVVPISILQLTPLVTFGGGRGFLFLTDVDTLFMDAMIVAGVLFVYRQLSRELLNAPVLTFLIVTACVSGLLLAYVVTNYGTLFRLRLMFSSPLWLLPLAVSGRPAGPRTPWAPPIARS